jgi:hypothetical protein
VAFGLSGFCHGFAGYTFSSQLPQVMTSVFSGQSNTVVGFAVMIPNLLAVTAMILVSWHSDRTLERRYYMATLGALDGIAFPPLGVPRSALCSVVLFWPPLSEPTAFCLSFLVVR